MSLASTNANQLGGVFAGITTVGVVKSVPYEMFIQKMFDGGYLVTKGRGGVGQYTEPSFACTTMDEALKYIKSKFEPKPPK